MRKSVLVCVDALNLSVCELLSMPLLGITSGTLVAVVL